MKYILSEQELEVPEDIEVDVKARQVKVKGKLGTLKRAFKHIPIEIYKTKSVKTNKPALKFRMWLQKKKRNAALGTIRSTIRNMITGVSVGYKFKMVLAYSHFPIVANVVDNGKVHSSLSRLSKSRTSLDSKPTRELIVPKESLSSRKKKTRTASLSRVSISKMFLKPVPESSNQLLSKTKIFELFLTASMFLTQDWSLLIDALFKPLSNHSYHIITSLKKRIQLRSDQQVYMTLRHHPNSFQSQLFPT